MPTSDTMKLLFRVINNLIQVINTNVIPLTSLVDIQSYHQANVQLGLPPFIGMQSQDHSNGIAELLRDLRGKSSCNSLVFRGMETDCQFADDLAEEQSSSASNLNLDQLKELLVVRLTLCDTLAANQGVPKVCQALVPSEGQILPDLRILSQQLKECRSALF